MVLASSFRYLKYMIYLCFAFGEMLAFGRVRKHAPEPIPREPHRIMADPDPVFVQEILDLAQRRRTGSITARWMISGLFLNYRHGGHFIIQAGCEMPDSAPRQSHLPVPRLALLAAYAALGQRRAR